MAPSCLNDWIVRRIRVSTNSKSAELANKTWPPGQLKVMDIANPLIHLNAESDLWRC